MSSKKQRHKNKLLKTADSIIDSFLEDKLSELIDILYISEIIEDEEFKSLIEKTFFKKEEFFVESSSISEKYVFPIDIFLRNIYENLLNTEDLGILFKEELYDLILINFLDFLSRNYQLNISKIYSEDEDNFYFFILTSNKEKCFDIILDFLNNYLIEIVKVSLKDFSDHLLEIMELPEAPQPLKRSNLDDLPFALGIIDTIMYNDLDDFEEEDFEDE